MSSEPNAASFAYFRDRLFLFSIAIYLVNKLVFKEIFSHGFCHAYVNDLICIPFTLPPILWGLRRLGLRIDDRPPSSWEIAGAALGFSLVFEVWLPMVPIQSRYIYADPWDVVSYAVGGGVAGLWWRYAYPAWRSSRTG
jgi:hypothetical protein